ncbi:MAG: acyltransferase [Chloroflexi bacterium]|nr:MAG: acyltransferase [Chloroflexota bacterium]
MAPIPAFSLGYRPALDGLRAVSILAVLSRHSGWLSGGYLGVDVFFALSGFLITALLTEEYGLTGMIKLRLFYARRALRLLPALAVCVVICEIVLLATLPPEFGPLALQQGAAVMFYVANWAPIWGLPMGVFSHAWSLAIEEQFYLVWPIILIVLLRGIQHRLLLTAVVSAAAGVACMWRLALTQPGTPLIRLYAGLDTHADSLLLGCAAGLLMSSGRLSTTNGVARGAIRIGGVLGAIALALHFIKSTFPGGYVLHQASVLTALASVLVIVDLCVPGSWLAIFFLLGALSMSDEVRPLKTVLAAWASTLTVAFASYVIVERPALAVKRRYSAESAIDRGALLTHVRPSTLRHTAPP